MPVWVTPSKKVGSRCVGPCRWAGRSRAWSGKRLEGPVGQVFPSSRAGEWGWLAPNQAPRPTGETVDQERRSPEAATRSVEQHSPPQLRTLQALAEERHQLQRAAARCLHHAIAPNSTSHGPLRPYTVYQPKWRRSSQPLTRPWLYKKPKSSLPLGDSPPLQRGNDVRLHRVGHFRTAQDFHEQARPPCKLLVGFRPRSGNWRWHRRRRHRSGRYRLRRNRSHEAIGGRLVP